MPGPIASTGTPSAIAATLMSRDANANTALNNLLRGFDSSSSGTGTLTKASPYALLFTGSSASGRTLPVVSTLSLGFEFLFINGGSADLSISSSGGNIVTTISPGGAVLIKCILITGTSAASWVAVPNPFVDTDTTMSAASTTNVPSQSAVIAFVGQQILAAFAAFKYPLSIFDHFDDSATTNTNGTEDTLRSDDIGNGVFLNILINPGDKVIQEEVVTTIGSATAGRRIKKYLNDGHNTNLIWDSGALTLSIGAEFHIRTTIIRIDDNTVRVDVAVTTTSASTVPYVNYTEITGLDGISSNVTLLLTTAIASGLGASPGDIVSTMSHTERLPAA